MPHLRLTLIAIALGTASACASADPPDLCFSVDCSHFDDDCVVGSCAPETGECTATAKPDGSACGDATENDCTAADTCRVGVCQAFDEPMGSPCDDQGADCHNDDICDGAGGCIDTGLHAVGSTCGDQTEDDCSAADTCDDAGNCSPNHAPDGAQCGDQTTTECTSPDSCDGNGTCNPNHAGQAGRSRRRR